MNQMRCWVEIEARSVIRNHFSGTLQCNSYIEQYHDEFDRLLFIMYIVNVLFSAILYLALLYSSFLKDYL